MPQYPLILQVDKIGNPKQWITHEKAAYYYTKKQVTYEIGNIVTCLHGGYNKLGYQSTLNINSIISVVEKGFTKHHHKPPTLSNDVLFRRDGFICAYCGDKFNIPILTRDHIIPKKYHGKNTWDNVITSCKKCNSHKGYKLLNQLNWTLRYEPYTPSHTEVLFYHNTNMLTEQYDYFMNCIPDKSRIHQFYKR